MPSHRVIPHIVIGFLCWIVTALPLIAAGNLSISGTLLDPAASPAPDVVVSLYSSTSLVKKTRTAKDGSFWFSGLLPGAYVLECEKEGFQKYSGRIGLGEHPEAMEILLKVAGLNQHVVVIASELPELTRETSKDASIISSEELVHRDVVSLSDALQQAASLQIQQQGGPGTVVSYRFRGLRPEDAAILVDGFRVSDASDNKGSVRPLLSDLLVTGADRIEILRGAGSALYGTNAIGGTVEMVSRQPAGPLGGSVSFQGGSLGLLEGGAELGAQTRNQRFSYLLRADHWNYTRGMDAHDAYRNNSGSAQAGLALKPQAHLFLRFRSNDSFALLNESPSPVPNLPALPPGEFLRQAIPFPKTGATFYPQFDDPDYHQRSRFFWGAARLDQQVSRAWGYSAGFQSLRSRRRYDDGPAVSPLARQLGHEDGPATVRQLYEGSTEQAFWRNSLQANSANLTHIVFDFERETMDQTAFGLTIGAVQRSLTFGISHQIRLLEGRWQSQVALQAQRYRLEPPRFSNNTQNPFAAVDRLDLPAAYSRDASTAYFIAASGTKVRLHAGTGYRAPSLYERFGSSGSAFRSYYGNPQLRPERSWSIDGGFDQFVFHEKLQVSGTYFHTHLTTIIDFGATPKDAFGRSFGYLNLKGGNARGVELSFSSRPSALLELTGSYTYSKSSQTSPTSAGTTRVLGLAGHQFTAGVNVKPGPRVNLNLLATGTSDYDFPVFGITFAIPGATYRFPGFFRLDLTGAYTLSRSEKRRVRWVTRVDNLLNRQYYQGGFLAPKAVVRSGIRIDF